ncbi:MAG: SDR family NAD(P)-dependent oxidoreductase [Dietzia sp.]|uniref:SDR family NAD(P)-dependent oxidoreductase n=1 Tax=Dietzia TaxID=37914 RepID=UPI0015F8043E|nr:MULTISPECIES: SDR family NAD(P)-dependent oxidoreductase [Dietzia]MBB1042281.1 SDR family NAD(P)-dependent oxidoreductase [Dietzia sp. Cai40]MBC7296033.1 SDR family NAD(P)-dependent oxidoreductase [Dietzia sp.]MCT1514471.1 SDR family NAD(P)-dependent oxidoreductase [Dietzia cercidiphylli]MDO8394221.1 SDR family NAD(P)-dependent oxidoreductase [Dietzia sp.]
MRLPRLPLSDLPVPGLARLPFVSSPSPADTNRRVLVTGGASGLGLALVTAFLERGDRVMVADLAATDDRPASVPGDARYLRLDVRSEEEWQAARAEIEQIWGGIDVLVNNAGIAQGGRIEYLTEEDWRLITDINLLGVARGCRTFVPMLKAQGHGHLVNTASLAGLVHPPTMASYTAVKAAVVAISETLRWELEPFGIDVSVLCPSFFRTNLASSLNSSDPAASGFASKLIDRSERGADEIAAEVMTGLDAKEFLILPDPDARKAYRGKRFMPAAYARTMLGMGQKFARATGGG